MSDDQRVATTDLKHFWCDDVHVAVVSFTKHERKKGKLPYWDITVGLYTRPSYDREVDVKLEVFRGDEIGLRLTQRKTEVEEGKNKLLSWAKEEADFSSYDGPWSLRIILDVHED